MPDVSGKKDRRFKTYVRLSDYIADFTITADLKLEDVSFVFKIYSVVLSIITLIYLLHYLTVRLLPILIDLFTMIANGCLLSRLRLTRSNRVAPTLGTPTPYCNRISYLFVQLKRFIANAYIARSRSINRRSLRSVQFYAQFWKKSLK